MRYAIRAAIVVAMLAVAFSQPARADVGLSFGFFYSNLSPHGSWLVSAQYGRVWQPGVYRPGWSPYYDGHWVYTDVGWTWDSDYAWGAIPYHYGTWVLDASLGWVWVPGYVWAPAWVEFYYGPDYIGWAPCPVNFSIGASFAFGVAQAPLFVFVSAHDFLAPRVGAYAVPAYRTRALLGTARPANSLVIQNNVVVNRGVDPAFVQRATGRTIRPIPVERAGRVAPFSRVTRSELAAGAQHPRGGLRVAEPFSARAPLPGAEQSRTAATGRRGGPGAERGTLNRPGIRHNETTNRVPSMAQARPAPEGRRTPPVERQPRRGQPNPQRAARRAPPEFQRPAPQRAERGGPPQPGRPAPQRAGRGGPPTPQRGAPQQRTRAGRQPQRQPSPQEQRSDRPGRG